MPPIRLPMSFFILHSVFIVFCFACLFGCSGVRISEGTHAATAHDTLWFREELYFGADIPTGGIVSDSLWEDFVNREVVSRFPDGFTTVPAMGRYRYSTGEIKKEPTRIVIVFYPPRSSQDSLKLGEIIRLYKTKFSQESVLRVRSKAEVKFP
jgi:hypothetical protein